MRYATLVLCSLLCGAVILASSPRARASDDLPEEIHIKSPTATFNSRFYFALKDGRIWFKPNPETTGIHEPWALFGRDGLPSNEGGDKTFVKPDRIISLITDADELAAISSDHHFYFIRSDNQSFLAGDFWTDGSGSPANKLILTEELQGYRGLALGRRNQDVEYWEDPLGNPHHWGFLGISTYYMLMQDGQDIRFFDTGLPADFSRHMCGPLRGQFIAENISASASTMFVIGKDGEMYTRLKDFDTSGTNPMFFHYSYQDHFRPNDRGSDPHTLYTTWTLPSEPWAKQPSIPLTGQARITNDITILQNGHGNAARELRVAGTDAEGHSGYYFKQLNDVTWNFRRTDQAIDPTHFLSPATGPQELGPSRDIHYSGHFRTGWHKELDVELVDFNLFCNPSRLRVHYGPDPGDTFDILLRTLDAWTFQQRGNPGIDGTPRAYLAAIELPPETRDSKNPTVRKLVKKYFAKHDLVPDAFLVYATTDYVQIRSNFLWHKVTMDLTRVGSGFATPEEAQAKEVDSTFGFWAIANADNLIIPHPEQLTGTPADMNLLNEKIKLNAYTLKQLKALVKNEKSEAFTLTLEEGAFDTLNALLRTIGLAYYPRIWPISKVGGKLLHAVGHDQRVIVFNLKRDYDQSKAIVERRLDWYQSVLKTLQRRARHAHHRLALW